MTRLRSGVAIVRKHLTSFPNLGNRGGAVASPSSRRENSMTSAELLLQDYDIEIANTRRTLERVPEGKNDWTPHAKSMPLGKLAMHCATLPMFGVYLMEDDGMDVANPTRPRPGLEFTTREA